MKLESFKDKKVTRRKMMLISLGIIAIVGVSLLLYKTFASFSSEVSFRIMSGKVNYFGDSDVLFGFYNGETKLDKMPQKGNSDNLVFEKAECDNGASVEWNEEKWAPLVKGLTKNQTKCTLYFGVPGVELLKKKAEEEQAKENPELMYDDTEDKNLRYVGANPNNYIDIGDRYKSDIYAFYNTDDDFLSGEYNSIEECESDNEDDIQYGYGSCEKVHNNGDLILWRIIGVMKNVTNVETNKKEDLIKIIRADSIGRYSWDTSEEEVNAGKGVNEWSKADLMKLLNPDSVYAKEKEIGNSLYWNNESGKCYIWDMDDGGEEIFEATKACDFTGNGISEEAKNKIVKVRWNTGTFATYDESEWTASATYKAERSETNGKNCTNNEYNECTDQVPRTTTWDGYIGLMNASDYGYAVGKSVRNVCLAKSMFNYSDDECYKVDWLLYKHSGYNDESTLNPISDSHYATKSLLIMGFGNGGGLIGGSVNNSLFVFPVVFLKSSVSISDALGTPEDPFVVS